MPSYTHKMATVSWPYILWRHFTLCIRRTTRPPSFSGRSFGRRTVYVMTLCRFPTGRNKASQSIISPVDRRSDRQENRRLPGADARWPIVPITISLSPLLSESGAVVQKLPRRWPGARTNAGTLECRCTGPLGTGRFDPPLSPFTAVSVVFTLPGNRASNCGWLRESAVQRMAQNRATGPQFKWSHRHTVFW